VTCRLAEEADFAVVSEHYFLWLDSEGHPPYASSVASAAAPEFNRLPNLAFRDRRGGGIAQLDTPKVRSRALFVQAAAAAASLVSTPCFATPGTVRPRHPFLKIASSHRHARLDLFGATPFRLEPGSLP